MRLSIWFVFLVFNCGVVHAELYRWVDEQGKVHFSDKKPPRYEADDISETVKHQNTDYGNRSTDKQLQQIERNKAARNTEQTQRQQLVAKQQEQRERDCQEAHNRLRIMKGRVIFYDEDNREVRVTEQEREQRVAALEQQINKYCQ